MKLGRRTKMAGIVAIALLIGVPYAVYAMEYRGEYKVTVSMDLTLGDQLGTVTVTNVEADSEPMGAMSFFDVLKAHDKAAIRANYSVYVELNHTGGSETLTDFVIVLPDQTVPFSLTFFEVSPGAAEVRVYVVWNLVDSIAYDYTWDVMIG